MDQNADGLLAHPPDELRAFIRNGRITAVPAKRTRRLLERWCFPDAPSRSPVPDRTDRWCFPDAPPRLPATDRDEPWCFLEDPPPPRASADPHPNAWLRLTR